MGYLNGMSKKSSKLSEFKEGQLCYAVLLKYKGTGPLKIILHEAHTVPEGEFGYGAGKHWIVSPSQLMGMSTSAKKSKASKLNGKKGGRPRGNPVSKS